MLLGGQRKAPAALPPKNRPGTHCIGGWVDRRERLEACEKSRPLPWFDPRTVQAVASRYTDWAIPAHIMYIYIYTLNSSDNRKVSNVTEFPQSLQNTLLQQPIAQTR